MRASQVPLLFPQAWGGSFLGGVCLVLLLVGVVPGAWAAAGTWYMTNTILNGVGQEMSETSPGADATTSPNTGWTVGKVGTGTPYSPLDSGVEQATGTFVLSPVHPDGTIDTATGDFLRTTATYNGTFAAGTWTFTAKVIAVTSGGDQDGNIAVRLHRSVNTDCSAATQITTARVAGGVVTNLTTTTAQTSTATFNPGAVTVTNAYLCLEIGWEITGAGGANTRDVVFQIGTTATTLTSPAFTPAAATCAPNLLTMGAGC